MDDRTLLELAAKAAGLTVWQGSWPQDYMLFAAPKKADPDGKVTGVEWNPLTDDGDALRLAVKLGIRIEEDWFRPSGGYDPDNGRARAYTTYSMELKQSLKCRPGWFKEEFNGDPYAATRRAVVRAAAELGRTTK